MEDIDELQTDNKFIIDSITEILRNQNRVEDTNISKANEVVKAVNFKIHQAEKKA